LGAFNVAGGTPVSTVLSWADEALTRRAWLLLLFHGFVTDHAASETAYRLDDFELLIEQLAARRIRVVTVHEGVSLMNPPPPPPVVASMTPDRAAMTGGLDATIRGSGFVAGTKVSFGGALATVVRTSPTEVTLQTPPQAAGLVKVKVDAQTADAGEFMFFAPFPPQLAGVSLATGSTNGWTPVTLTGSGFLPGVSVTFGGAAAAVESVSDGAIAVRAPASAAGTVDVVVTNPDRQSSTLPAAFTFIPPPRLTAVAPALGAVSGGATVTLSGSDFSSGAAVTFGAAPATVVRITPTSLVVSAPAHAAGPVDVVVTNRDGQSATLPRAFTFCSPPVLASLSATQAPTAGGAQVTLLGANFLPGAAVSFGGVAATVTAAAPASLSVRVPAHAAGAVDVVVVNPEGQSASLPGAFTFVPPPRLDAVTPAIGAMGGGTAVALSGGDFVEGATAMIGGVPGVVSASSPAFLLVTSGAHAPGAVDVRVVNPDGQFVTLPAAFTYLRPPRLLGVSPPRGPSNGGTRLRLEGADFLPGSTVVVGGLPAAIERASATEISAVLPAGAPGVADVAVTNPDGQTATLPGAFTWVGPPVLRGLSPQRSRAGERVTVTIDGRGFEPGVTVSFGGSPAEVRSVTAAALVVAAPPDGHGAVDVQVTNLDGQSGVARGAFTYLGGGCSSGGDAGGLLALALALAAARAGRPRPGPRAGTERETTR
jgi:hypothetical protein